MNIIEILEKEQADRLEANRPIPEFAPGDTVRVNVKVIEGERTRVQAYEGVCIGRSGGGINESFTVRKISYGEGVERVFPIYSPLIDSIEVVRRGKVRRAKLYYLRGRRGKSARIREKQDFTRKDGQRRTFKGFKRPKGEPDDLTKIANISDNVAAQLLKIGVAKYEQIAAWTDDEIAQVDDALNLKGRIERDNWIGEAAKMMAEATADEVPADEDEAEESK